MKFILGKKVEMTQRFEGDKNIGTDDKKKSVEDTDEGRVLPVTVIKVEPCVVTQIKTDEKDGYFGIQLGFGKKKHITKPMKGHLKDRGQLRYIKEFRLSEATSLKDGDTISVGIFQSGDIIKVTGVSKGKGFQGVVKRHGFSGSPGSHGHKDQLRMPGSIGATGPARVFKGTRMAGRMGGKQASTRNLEIIDVDKENNYLLIKGSVPGARNSVVQIFAEGEMLADGINAQKKEKKPVEDKKEDKKVLESSSGDKK